MLKRNFRIGTKNKPGAFAMQKLVLHTFIKEKSPKNAHFKKESSCERSLLLKSPFKDNKRLRCRSPRPFITALISKKPKILMQNFGLIGCIKEKNVFDRHQKFILKRSIQNHLKKVRSMSESRNK
jgi:hypothetical protein